MNFQNVYQQFIYLVNIGQGQALLFSSKWGKSGALLAPVEEWRQLYTVAPLEFPELKCNWKCKPETGTTTGCRRSSFASLCSLLCSYRPLPKKGICLETLGQFVNWDFATDSGERRRDERPSERAGRPPNHPCAAHPSVPPK